MDRAEPKYLLLFTGCLEIYPSSFGSNGPEERGSGAPAPFRILGVYLVPDPNYPYYPWKGNNLSDYFQHEWLIEFSAKKHFLSVALQHLTSCQTKLEQKLETFSRVLPCLQNYCRCMTSLSTVFYFFLAPIRCNTYKSKLIFPS